MKLLEDQGQYLNEVLTACGVEEIAGGGVQSFFFEAIVAFVNVSLCVTDRELSLAAVALES